MCTLLFIIQIVDIPKHWLFVLRLLACMPVDPLKQKSVFCGTKSFLKGSSVQWFCQRADMILPSVTSSCINHAAHGCIGLLLSVD